jgi:preprotein translocase subunit YajC
MENTTMTEVIHMYRKLMRNTTMALGTLLLGSSLVMAGGLQGTVSAVDGKGMATVHTSDGKDHQVKAGEGWKVGAKVECETKNNAMECRPAAAQSSAAPTTSSPSTAAVKPAPAPTTPAPAPSTAAPAPSTSTPASK